MQRMELVVPCHFGLEAVCKKEIQDLGYDVHTVSDGKVHFIGDAEAIVRANIFLRTGGKSFTKAGLLPCGILRGFVSGYQGPSVGRVSAKGCLLLGDQGQLREIQAVFAQRYSVRNEESHG